MADYVHSPSESDEFIRVGYRASSPRKRDFWRVLRGRWKPEVNRVETYTCKGLDRELKSAWTSEKVREQWLDPSPLSSLYRVADHGDA